MEIWGAATKASAGWEIGSVADIDGKATGGLERKGCHPAVRGMTSARFSSKFEPSIRRMSITFASFRDSGLKRAVVTR